MENGALLTDHKNVSSIDRKGRSTRQWRSDELFGRCFGIGPYYEMFPDFAESNKRNISSAKMCKKHCCRLGDACITWQVRVYITTTCTSFDARCEYVFTARSLVGERKITTVDWAVLFDLEAKALEPQVCAVRVVQFMLLME